MAACGLLGFGGDLRDELFGLLDERPLDERPFGLLEVLVLVLFEVLALGLPEDLVFGFDFLGLALV
ncbi:MAG TPA: hypothetical protein VH275_10050 [Solirubrobacterales bacterium]|jgi:hypothetical protein|nr:hypothetical protein [Solirubrobacterales bacterium]